MCPGKTAMLKIKAGKMERTAGYVWGEDGDQF